MRGERVVLGGESLQTDVDQSGNRIGFRLLPDGNDAAAASRQPDQQHNQHREQRHHSAVMERRSGMQCGRSGGHSRYRPGECIARVQDTREKGGDFTSGLAAGSQAALPRHASPFRSTKNLRYLPSGNDSRMGWSGG